MTEEIKSRLEQIRAGKVPKGYRQSPSGVIPRDWHDAKMSDVTEAIKETAGDKEYETLSISAGVGFVNQAKKFGREMSGAQYSKYTVLRHGDFSYNKGNSNLYPQGCIYRLHDREEAAVPNVFESFRFDSLNGDYYEQLFVSGYLNKQLYSKINHGVRDDGLLNLTGKDFYSCHLPVPPLPEQKRIAEILMQCDKVIALKKARIEEEKKQKQWLMDKLLIPSSGYRLPGYSTPWKYKSFAKCFKFIRNGFVGTATPFYCENGIPYIEGMNIKDGRWCLETVEHVTLDFQVRHPHSVLQEGDLVVVQSGHIGECAVVPKSIAGSNCHAIIIMTPTESTNPYFCMYYINSVYGKKSLTGVTTGNTIKHILASDMRKYHMSMPDICEQTEVANLLISVDRTIVKSEQEVLQWRQKKKALMQLLLTGIARVNA